MPSVSKTKLNTELSPAAVEINGSSVVKANNQTSKRWFVVAILVGSIVVIGVGGFGSMGLLQSHSLISLPKDLSSAISTIGNAGLWLMASGGILGGGIFIAWGAYKIHLSEKRAYQGFEDVIKVKKEESEEQPKELTDEQVKLEKEIVEFNFDKESEDFENTFHDQKFYQTQIPEKFDGASIGDYCFIPYREPYKLLVIKDTSKRLKVIVRESSRYPKHFRLVRGHPSHGIQESSLLFTAPQLSAMMRHASNPQNGIKVSGFTNLVRSATGLIIFTNEDKTDKKYFLVNSKGALVETPLIAIIVLIKKLSSK